nr:hypothetical protein BgiMline_014800 [Biomphalaria glabrata]
MKSSLLCLIALLIVGCMYTSEGAPTQCPNMVYCFVAPCGLARCSVLGAVCHDDYCGGCYARWYVGSKEVTSQCTSGSIA